MRPGKRDWNAELKKILLGMAKFGGEDFEIVSLSEADPSALIRVSLPGLGSSVVAYPWGLCITVGIEKQMLKFADLRTGQVMAPSLGALQRVMYQDRLKLCEISFGSGVGNWSYVRAPGVVLAFLWTIILEINSGRYNLLPD